MSSSRESRTTQLGLPLRCGSALRDRPAKTLSGSTLLSPYAPRQLRARRRISRARRRYAIYDGRIAISEARAAYAQHKEIFDEPPQPRSSSDLRACHRIGELLGGGTATRTFSACDQSANETT